MIALVLRPASKVRASTRMLEAAQERIKQRDAMIAELRQEVDALRAERRRLIAGLQAANAGALAAVRPEARA